ILISFFLSSRRRHTRSKRDWSSDVCSSDLSRACRLIGLNPNGEVEWERDVVLTAFLETSARFLSVEYLPPYAQVEMADSTKEFIDPVTGETVKELPDEMAASSMFNDLVFVTDSESSSCETTA